MKPSVTVSINAVRAALSPTEYRTTKEIMSITGYSYGTVYNALITLVYRRQVHIRNKHFTRYARIEARLSSISGGQANDISSNDHVPITTVS